MLVFLVSGTVKGSLGIGFPAIAMSIFPMFIEPALGVALLAMPIFVTNFVQFVTIRGWRAVVARFIVAGIAVAATIFIVVQFVEDIPSRWINIVVGLSLVTFALAALLKFELPVTESAGWQIAAGVTAGLLGGVSAVKAPIMIYTVALKLPRDEFIAAAGFLFFCGGVGIFAGLATAALLNGVTLTLSLASLCFALVGFRIGAWIRGHLSEKVFRLALLWLILVLGLRLIAVNLLW